MDWRDTAERAGWTFAETFLVVIIPALSVASGDHDASKLGAAAITAGLAAAAAGLSVVKTALKTWLARG